MMDNKVGCVPPDCTSALHALHTRIADNAVQQLNIYAFLIRVYRCSNMVFARGATVLTSLANIKVLDLNWRTSK